MKLLSLKFIVDLKKRLNPGDNFDELNFSCDIQPPGKPISRFKRGKLVLCLVLSPENRNGELKNLLLEETTLTDKHENQKFLIVEKPCLELSFKNKSYPVYICDNTKGATVNLKFERDSDLAKVYCDTHMLSNILDISFLSKMSNIKPDWKQLVSIAIFGAFIGWMFGLMF